MKKSHFNTFVVTVISTKGDVTKSTNVANIGAFCADSGIKTLMIDTDVQPTLSSYYHLNYSVPKGLFEFLIHRETEAEQIISKTEFTHLDIIQSNDPTDTITTYLRNYPDEMLRFNDLIEAFHEYELILVDTRGTRGITVDMSVLASDLVLSPLKPELLSAREFMRGTLGLYQQLQAFTKHDFTLPKVKAIINCLDHTNDGKSVVESLKSLFAQHDAPNMELLDFTIPSRVAYREAASLALPVHRHSKKEKQNIRQLCILLFPQWKDKF
ncbi:ParA family protein [Pasteurella oralis]|uniref:ParA family protein n=1 Tax=Pasteurella oralis TaxID=1071947 RepID=A0ABW4NUB3_9PAST